MQFISDTEAKQKFASILDKVQREPVIIRQENRDVAVVLSIEEYQRIMRINIQEFQKFRENIGRKAQERGLTEDKLNEMLSND
ncbi:type II toxin-antitoxin system Phd/YefM family antitoxin [Sphaerospermopsis sp. LEGE 08334]|jgi:prevent-host-death family protein|uniref:type II toxin-antitoxin system Phd/YefM family antitoxin n=1 Tax=Sphaerospermopsis sp. LEGE 08334 TaxID=1828651 RepID=UPI001881A5BB|nr:type II toxin-antitoxin system Phd/YefM family antitoxin [Sphaerospermopsis sp. LEGE 08334]MBE9054588.1 type II toxin-antitoxin system Phd/YefM family antitoxin [Sphaerospermopsis sp. LEGE 08334]